MLIPGSGGIFDVEVDGKIIFSKQNFPEGEQKRFPNKGELLELLK